MWLRRVYEGSGKRAFAGKNDGGYRAPLGSAYRGGDYFDGTTVRMCYRQRVGIGRGHCHFCAARDQAMSPTFVITKAAELLVMTGSVPSMAEADMRVRKAVRSGDALAKLAEVIEAQGGNPRQIEHPELLPTAPVRVLLTAACSGYIAAIDAERVGLASMQLGAGPFPERRCYRSSHRFCLTGKGRRSSAKRRTPYSKFTPVPKPKPPLFKMNCWPAIAGAKRW